METINLYNGKSKGSNIMYTDIYRIADAETRKHIRLGNGNVDGLILTTFDHQLNSHSLWEYWTKSQC